MLNVKSDEAAQKWRDFNDCRVEGDPTGQGVEAEPEAFLSK